MPESFVKQYKSFTSMQEILSTLKKDSEIKQDKLALLSAGKTSLQENIFDARIINRSIWTGYNELRFKLVNPPLEIKYFPKEGSQDKVFGLVEVSDGQFEIQVLEK